MSENLSYVICNLSGNALQVGGQCFLGYGVLYSIRGVSNALTDALEYMPRYFNTPESLFLTDGTQPQSQIFLLSSSSYTKKNVIRILSTHGTRIGLIIGIIGLGVSLKHVGRLVAHPDTISKITNMTGG